ncbi:MAG: polyisoprenoid-binding protein [Xanthomonadales bacterium]|nr:polyisoprenoid-binding protein [Xanthomonadales bacterium]
MRHLLQHAVFAAVTDPANGGGAPAGLVTYTLDPGHTEVVARWNHFGFSTPAAIFCQVKGTLAYDAAQPERSRVEVSIPVASMHTTVPKQDEHLRSAEFFDAEKYPEIHFQSTKVERGPAEDQLLVTGTLSIHGVSKPVTLDVHVNQVGVHGMHNVPAAGFDATAQVNRSAFGIGAFAPAVSDRIDLRITAEAIESKAWAAIEQAHAG